MVYHRDRSRSNGVLSNVKHSNGMLFADDTEIHSSDSNIDHVAKNINSNLVSIEKWLVENEMVAHPGKSEVLKTGSRPALKNAISVIINLHNHELNEVNTKRYLGVILNNHLTWNDHFSYICKKVYPKLRLLDRISSFLPRHALLCVYKQAIMPIFDYGCIVWMECTKHISDKIEKLQNRVMRIILKTDRKSCSQDMRSKLGLLSLYNCRRFLRFQLSYRIVNNFMCS